MVLELVGFPSDMIGILFGILEQKGVIKGILKPQACSSSSLVASLALTMLYVGDVMQIGLQA